MKKPYARIDFTNCSLECDYTICTWDEVGDYLTLCEGDFICDERGFLEWQLKGYVPKIEIQLVMLTDKEYNNFVKQMEKNA